MSHSWQLHSTLSGLIMREKKKSNDENLIKDTMSGKTEVDEEHMFSYGDDPEEGGWAESQFVIRTEEGAQLRQQMAPRPPRCCRWGVVWKAKTGQASLSPLSASPIASTPMPVVSSLINSISLPASRVS